MQVLVATPSTPPPKALHVVIGEIQNVVARMRLNSRWASSASRLMSYSEGPLLQGFKALRNTLSQVEDLTEMDPLTYLKPFLGVIRSEETSGPITGVALSSINKFLNYGFIHEKTPNAAKAVATITEIVSNCRFEATQTESDEVVLATILEVLLSCLRSPAGFLLTDELVFSMVQTCFRLSVQSRLSELLRKQAEYTLSEMIQTVFLNCNQYCKEDSVPKEDSTALVIDDDDAFPDSNSYAQPPSIPPSPDLPRSVEPGGGAREEGMEKEKESVHSGSGEVETRTNDANTNASRAKGEMEFINPRGIRFQRNEETASSTGTVGSKPYGLSCLNKLFGFLCSLIQPKPSNTVSIRQLGLSLINTILEIQCPPFPAHLLPLVRNDLCKNLCLNLLSEELSIFTLTLRIWYNLFNHQSYKEALKLQMEAFLLCMLNTVMDSRYSSYEKQELALESLLEFCSSPSFLVELYLNFDCDIYCANLFESLCKFLYKNAFPVSGSLYTLHVLSLDVLLAAIQAISERCKNPPSIPEGYPSAEELSKRKQLKRLLALAAEHWNKDYKEGLKFLQEYHLLPDPLDAPSVAAFLRNTPGLDKTIIGQYLGKEHDFNKAVLQAYLNTFNFQGVSLLPALRTFLETFRLHGETGQITRILENFSSRYYECNPTTFADEDSCYLLTFSVVLLNSDLHNASVPKKMKQSEFIANLRETNGGKDHPRQMLIDIYNSILAHPFKLLEDYDGDTISALQWRSLLKKARRASPYISTSCAAYDKDMFSIILGCPIIAAISVVFDTAEDEAILQKALGGFNLCAEISAYYNLGDVFDNLVISLCKFSTLLSAPKANGILAFGRNRKAQLATQAVFNITQKYGNHFREGWKYILSCLLTLRKLKLLPPLADLQKAIEEMGNSSGKNSSPLKDPIPGGLPATWLPRHFLGRRPAQKQKRDRNKNASSGSVFSGFTFIGTGGWFEQVPEDVPSSPEDLEAEQATMDCIANCNINSILLNSRLLQADSLVYLLKALILGSVVRPGGSLNTKQGEGFIFDEKTNMFCLDLVTAVTLLNQERIIFLWVLVYEHFSGIIMPAKTCMPLVERAIMDLSLLCIKLVHNPAISDQVLRALQLFMKMNSNVSKGLIEHIVSVLATIIHGHPCLITTPQGCSIFFELIQFCANEPKASETSFDILQALVSGADVLSPTTFFAMLDTAKSFAKSRSCSQSISLDAMELMYSLFSATPRMLHLYAVQQSYLEEEEEQQEEEKQLMHIQKQAITGITGDKGWDKFTKRVLLDFCELCDAGEQRPEVRHNAIVHLQRALLSPIVRKLPQKYWLACFYEVLFPFLERLLATSSHRSPSSHRRNPQHPQSASSLEEIRLRAPWLLSKIFLHYMGELWKADEFERLWMHVLQFIEVYMNTGDSDLLTETVLESLKNILLVMSTSGMLLPPPRPSPSKPSSLPANSAPSEEFSTDATITPPQQQEKDKTQDGNDDEQTSAQQNSNPVPSSPPLPTVEEATPSSLEEQETSDSGEDIIEDPLLRMRKRMWERSWERIMALCPQLPQEFSVVLGHGTTQN